MPNRIDTFESVFRRANKPIFRFSPPKVEKILLMSDLSGHQAQRFEERVRRFVETGEPGGRITWELVHGEKPDTRGRLQSAEMEVKAAEQDLNVARQNLELSRSVLRAAERKLHILGLTGDEIAELRDNNPSAHADVTRYVMRAPFEGIVIEKHIALGEALGGDAEAFVVADLRSVWVDIGVYQKDLPVVREKQSF